MARLSRAGLWLISGGVVYLALVCGFIWLGWLFDGFAEWGLGLTSLLFFPLPVLLWILLARAFPAIDRDWTSVIVGLFLVTVFSSCVQPIAWFIVAVAIQPERRGGHAPGGGEMIIAFHAFFSFLPILASLLVPRLACRSLRPGAFSTPPSDGGTPPNG